MKKLLHERLREIDESHTGEIKVQGVDVRLFPVEAVVLADEIERYYIPRPRFKDGEPVQFGDKFEKKNGNEGTVTSIHFTEGHYYINKKHATGRPQLSEPLKRIATKVLDADGVEINVGETCWYTDNLSTDKYIGNRVEIKEIFGKDHINVFNYDYGHWQFEILSSSLTHKEPDSLIKLRDDMDEQAKNGGDEGVLANVDEWVDRLSAMIERGA